MTRCIPPWLRHHVPRIFYSLSSCILPQPHGVKPLFHAPVYYSSSKFRFSSGPPISHSNSFTARARARQLQLFPFFRFVFFPSSSELVSLIGERYCCHVQPVPDC